jgi:hypothetical protein
MLDFPAQYPPGSTFTAIIHWRLDLERDIRVTARFLVEVALIDHADARFLCLIKSLETLTTTHPPDGIDPDLLARIHALPGKRAFLPFEAAAGRTLFLKVGTLTGRNNYFLDADDEKIARFKASH